MAKEKEETPESEIVTQLKIRYTGKGLKVVELPIPFVSKSEKEGEVVLDPDGYFSVEDGKKLLRLTGNRGYFKIVGLKMKDGSERTPTEAERKRFSSEAVDEEQALLEEEALSQTFENKGKALMWIKEKQAKGFIPKELDDHSYILIKEEDYQPSAA